jgi:hypothetical protein
MPRTLASRLGRPAHEAATVPVSALIGHPSFRAGTYTDAGQQREVYSLAGACGTVFVLGEHTDRRAHTKLTNGEFLKLEETIFLRGHFRARFCQSFVRWKEKNPRVTRLKRAYSRWLQGMVICRDC